MDIKQVCWKCSCGETAEPTISNYHRLLSQKEHRGHRRALVHKETGEEIAREIVSARKRGVVFPDAKKRQPVPSRGALPLEREAEAIPDTVEVERLNIRCEQVFRMNIVLPADAFVLFDLARAVDLEDRDVSFDEWVWDCIRKRFEKDYCVELVLVPVA